MTTQANPQIRFVKCPRCRKILAESPELPVYQCGGCGIILQAKHRKPEINNTELTSQETDSAEEGQQDNGLGGIEDRSSNDDLTDSPIVESSPDEGKIRCQDDRDGSVELSHNRGASDCLSGSPDITSPRSEAFPLEVQESFGNNPLSRSLPGRDQGKSEDEGDDSVELSHDRGAFDNLSGCETSPTEVQVSLENSPLGRSCQKHRSKSDNHEEWTAGSNSLDELPSSGEISLEAEVYTREAGEHVEHLEQMKDGESQRVWPKGDNFVDQESGLQERIKETNVLPENEEMTRTFLTDQNGESSGEIRHVGPISPSAMISHGNGIISPPAEVVDEGSKGLPVSRIPSTEKSTSPKASDSIHAPRSPSRGSLVSFYLTSEDEQLDHSPREVAHNFVRFSSMDTLGSSHLGDLSSELNFRNGSMAYHPTSRSYYAYDSESSYDGIEHVSHPSRRDKDVIGHIRTREELKKGGFIGEAKRTYQATSPSRSEMHHRRNRGQSTEANRYNGRSRMRLDAQGDISRLAFPLGDHTAGRRPSVNQHNLLPPHPALNLSDKSPYSDPDKIDLLRTVHHLKDQLERMHFKALPYLAAEREMYADVSHSGPCNRRRDHAKGYGERYNERRMAFSGEAAHFRHQASCSCLHCSPQDWHYRKNGHRVIHSDHNCFDYASSESLSWGCETKPHSQRLDEIKRLKLRERYSTGKRHLRPVAGGAPVIACYHCSELLQLPVDFLLFKKRYHQLMCNACRKVLRFSFLKGTHLVPYVADAAAPPPSEADDYNGWRNVEPASHSSSCQHVDAVSCSDDYGRSFCRSCCTEGEALSPFDRVKRESYNGKMSSGSSYEDQKLKGITKESVGPSSSRKVTWRNATTSAVSEIEELPPLSNSPLHRLMGYSTPSQVFKR